MIEIFVSRSLGKKSIIKFQKNLLSLLDYYIANVARIVKLYKCKPYKIILQDKKVRESPTKNNLKIYTRVI